MTFQYASPPSTADKVGTSIPEYRLSQPGYLLDTNIVIDLVTNLIALTGSISTHFISVITLVELCKNTNADAMIVDIEIAKAARYLRSTTRLKVPDAVIAATALHNGLTLVTEDRQLLAIPNLGAISYDRFIEQIGASND